VNLHPVGDEAAGRAQVTGKDLDVLLVAGPV